jgi:hypothetical protein
MAKVKLALNELNGQQIVQLADTIVTRMTGNANFPTPNPALTVITALRDTASTKLNQAQATRTLSEQHTGEANTAVGALKGGLTSLGSYVDNASGGDETKIRSTGMDVRDPSAAIGDLPQVQNLAVTAGDNDGELDAVWDPVKGRRIYEVQSSADPFSPTSWTTKANPTASKVTLTGFPSASKAWVRVRAHGTAGPGPWSDPALKVVP